MIGARLLAVLELGLRDGGTEIDIPERWRFELIRNAALEQPQKRACDTRCDRRSMVA
jgi:hypothetical protein